MLALLALAVLAPLLYVPGALIVRALSGERLGNPLDRGYTSVALGALLNGWLAFTLGQLGVFSAWLHLALVTLICALAALKVRRSWVRSHGSGASAFRSPLSAFRFPLSAPSLALAAILAIFALLVARPFEVVIGVRDAGVYANAGFAMARTGGLQQRDELVAQIAADQRAPDRELADAAAQAETNFLGVQNPQRFIATRLRAAGFFIYEGDMDAGRVTPQGLHLFTAWVGLLAGLLGPHGGLLAPGLMGLLGVWSVGMLARRLAGPWAGALAALLLSLNAAQVWFSRYSTTETTAQFLTFAGLYFFAVATTDHGPRTTDHRRSEDIARPSSEQEARRSDDAASALGASTPQRLGVPALLAGLAFGQLALARIDFFLVLAPLALYLLYMWLSRRWWRPHTALAAALGLLLLHAALQFTTLARAYFFDTLYARLQDYALTALLTLPFLTPALRETFLRRPCSPLTLQPCPPVDGMPPTSDAPFNLPRIGGELGALLLVVLVLLALRRWGGPLIGRLEAAVRRASGALLGLGAAATLLLGAYAYLVRPQILTAETLAALPSCLAPSQLRAPQGACLALQGYVGAPIAAPGYLDPLAAALGALPQLLRGQPPPAPAACAALRAELLPAAAKGLTVPELIDDKLLDPQALDETALARLRACDRLVLRAQFANSQANLVRVGWYTSPLGIVLSFAGLALLWRNRTPGARMFLAVALVAGLTFVRLTYGTSDQHYIYILRRYVPQVYPALALAAAVALVSLTQSVKYNVHNWLPRPLWYSFFTLHVALIVFLLATGLPIFRHTEYGGALGQVAAAAARFAPGDVVLMRGGAPTHAAARDLPDVLATPLRFAFDVDALTVKSRDPGRYAEALARYVREWQARGRQVYLAAGPSGALQLPGLALAPAGMIGLSLDEFEQLTDQKPRNVQSFEVEFALYRLVPAADAPPPPGALGPQDYAAQLGGFYRAEQAGGEPVAWTDGEALLRVETPPGAPPQTIALRLAGGERPQQLGPASACLSAGPLAGPWSSDAQPALTPPVCFTLAEGAAEYALPLPPDMRPAPGQALLVRITSATWIPARDDPQGRDPRRLGVQFAGLRLIP